MKNFAQIISNLLSPVIILPLIFIKLFLSPDHDGDFALLLFFLLGVVPSIAILIMLKKLGKISDWEISNRKERHVVNGIILSIMSILFIIYKLYVTDQFFASLLLYFIVWVGLYSLITRYTKISLHTASFTLFAVFNFVAPVIFFRIFFLDSLVRFIPILLVPVVAWSRIYLKRHTRFETIAGILLSTVGLIFVFIIGSGIAVMIDIVFPSYLYLR